MKLKLLAMLLLLAFLLTACGYVVVENSEREIVGSIFMPVALADEEGERVILSETEDAETEKTKAEEAETKDAKAEDAKAEEAETEDAKAEEAEAEETEAEEIEPEGAPVQIARGDRGEQVKRLQQLLKSYGFLNGTADGQFGAKTESAVIDAQNYRHEMQEEAAKQARKLRLEEARRIRTQCAENLNALRTSEDAFLANGDDFFPNDISAEEVREEPVRFRADGIVTEEFLSYLADEFASYTGDMKVGSSGRDVRRLQTRLKTENYLYGSVDGSFGSGTKEALAYFQKLNGLKETGIADERTQSKLFSAQCKTADYPVYQYRVEISVAKQRVYVYRWKKGAYSELVKSMKCTTGAVDTPTPLGSFRMGGPCGRWYYFQKFECWAQYASRITGGILFHSVLYSEKNENTLRQGSVDALGTRASHGCVRLSVSDAKWIYNNIPAGTTCRVYN